MLPNVLAPALVAATLGIANVILLEAGLSYLGYRCEHADRELGRDHSGRRTSAYSELWWLALFPGLAILATVFACNALGDALRDAFDPRQLPRDTSDATFAKEA